MASTSLPSSIAWSRAWVRTTFVPAATQIIPVWAGIGIGAALLFGPTALHADDATCGLLATPAALAVVALTWIVLCVPTAHALLRAPGSEYLRGLPRRGGVRALLIFVGAMVAQLPWLALWGLGRGAPAALIASSSCALAMIALGAIRAPAVIARVPHWRSATTAMIGVHARAIVRTAGAAASRALGFALLGGMAAGGLIAANQLHGIAAITAACVATLITVAIASAGITVAIARSDRNARWLSHATGTSWIARVTAMATIAATIHLALAITVGAVAAWMGNEGSYDAVVMLAMTALIGLAHGVATPWIAAIAQRNADGANRINGATIVACEALMTIIALTALGTFGLRTIAALLAVGIAAMVRTFGAEPS